MSACIYHHSSVFQENENVDPLDKLSTAQVINVLLDTYQSSPYAMQAAAKVHEITQIVSKLAK